MTDQDQDNVLVFLGAEGYLEAEHTGWFRDATEEEHAEHGRDQRDAGESRSIDKIGRPYFLVVLTDYAPTEVHERARKYVRVLRLTD